MDSMTLLALAMASFVATHLLMSHPLRAPLVRALGERGLLGLYVVIAFITFGATVYLAWSAPTQAPQWVASTGVWHAASLVMLIAAVLLVGSLIGNPAMVDPGASPKFPDQARGVYAVTRHPMMWSFILWAIVHASLWGTGRNLIIAAGIGGLALVGALGQDAKKAQIIGQPWRDWQARTSFVPFAALLSGRARWGAAMPGTIPLIGGLALWFAATWLHPVLGGPVAGPWLWMR
ncbi:MAG: MFS transporter [Sphingomonadales bacterium]|nr:MFS transporter [Sphingomonadales bacterium]